jgi:predicted ATPase
VEQLTIESDDGAASLEFAALLKRFRLRARLSQQALADRALISVQAVSALERGYRKAPYRVTVDRLSDAMDLSSEERAALETAASRARSALIERDATHNLPRQLTSFLGRDSVVAEIVSLLTTNLLVNLVATGGAGKTRTAVEVARRVFDRFPDGVWFVELAPLKDPDLLTSALAGALRIQETVRRSLLETILAYLQRKRLLIVLDNCEHVIAQARIVVGSLLRECPNVSILATSREALGIAGERAYQVPPLEVPHQPSVSAAEATKYGAVALFADRASAAGSRFAVTNDNVQDVVKVCRRLDGLPLAIELAANRATVLSPRQLSQRLEYVFEFLTADGKAVVPRHQTMRAVIDWSYQLLSVHARLLFDRLSTFANGFTLESATAVCADETLPRDDVFDLLTSLVTRSMVMVDFSRGAARYHLLQAPRQCSLERLNERGEQERLARRHALACLSIAERLDQSWYGCGEHAWLAEAEEELDNCRAALAWALEDGHELRAGRRLAAALARIWYSLTPVEGRRWIRSAIASLDDGPYSSVAGTLYVVDAELCGALGEYKGSLDSAEQALLALRTNGDSLYVTRARKAAGNALCALGHPSEGEHLLEEALVEARRVSNKRLQAMILGDLGTARSRRGDLSAARLLYAEALSSYAALGLERPAASIVAHLAEVEFAAGDSSTALARAQEALRGHELTQNRRSVANDLSNIAAYLAALDRFDDARDYATRALLAARDVGATVLTAYALQHVTAIQALRRDEQDVRRSRERAAILLGFVDSRLRSLGARREYTEQQEYERVFGALSAALGLDTVNGLMAVGETWSEDGAVTVALGA